MVMARVTKTALASALSAFLQPRLWPKHGRILTAAQLECGLYPHFREGGLQRLLSIEARSEPWI